jgi:hypothetical protein
MQNGTKGKQEENEAFGQVSRAAAYLALRRGRNAAMYECSDAEMERSACLFELAAEVSPRPCLISVCIFQITPLDTAQ